MIFLQIFLLTLCTPMNIGEEFCSGTSINVTCLPCSEICPPENKKCESIYYCPKQCGESISGEHCSDVCDSRCLYEKCEYSQDGQLECSRGCKDGWAGNYCQESCASRCKQCHRSNLTCIICVDNFVGENCERIATVTERETGTFHNNSTINQTVGPMLTTHNTYEGVSGNRSYITPTSGFVAGGILTLVLGGVCYIMKRKISAYTKRKKRSNNMPLDNYLVAVNEDPGPEYAYIDDINFYNSLQSLSSTTARPFYCRIKHNDCNVRNEERCTLTYEWKRCNSMPINMCQPNTQDYITPVTYAKPTRSTSLYL